MTEATGKKIDRVWDVTRVMRMPGTLNWRAGDGPGHRALDRCAALAGRGYAGARRLSAENVTARFGLSRHCRSGPGGQ